MPIAVGVGEGCNWTVDGAVNGTVDGAVDGALQLVRREGAIATITKTLTQ
ncbi:MAG: hypothetical protein MUF49_23025 [Oculatellaceae cyanobacterium Prado106]|nr:hypothetical protein [Oculatellaceae cyanobacterium Prado106]